MKDLVVAPLGWVSSISPSSQSSFGPPATSDALNAYTFLLGKVVQGDARYPAEMYPGRRA
jgi:hypothetical protein